MNETEGNRDNENVQEVGSSCSCSIPWSAAMLIKHHSFLFLLAFFFLLSWHCERFISDVNFILGDSNNTYNYIYAKMEILFNREIEMERDTLPTRGRKWRERKSKQRWLCRPFIVKLFSFIHWTEKFRLQTFLAVDNTPQMHIFLLSFLLILLLY